MGEGRRGLQSAEAAPARRLPAGKDVLLARAVSARAGCRALPRRRRRGGPCRSPRCSGGAPRLAEQGPGRNRRPSGRTTGVPAERSRRPSAPHVMSTPPASAVCSRVPSTRPSNTASGSAAPASSISSVPEKAAKHCTTASLSRGAPSLHQGPCSATGTVHRCSRETLSRPTGLPGTSTTTVRSGVQFPRSQSCDTMRVPGARASRRGRSCRLTRGSRYIVTTVARARSVANRSWTRNSVRASMPAARACARLRAEQHCAACHGDWGEGVLGMYLALAGNRAVTLASHNNLVRGIRLGGFMPTTAGIRQPFGMPPYGQVLNDNEIAALAGASA